MESITTHAVAVEVPRQCRQGREPRQTVVERGVETGDLRQSRPGTTDGGDPREIVRLMQRRQRTELKKLGLQRPRDDGGTVAVRATVDDAMPDGGQRSARGMLLDRLQEQRQHLLVVGDGSALVEHGRARSVEGTKAPIRHPDAIDAARPKAGQDLVIREECKLHARRPAVDHQDGAGRCRWLVPLVLRLSHGSRFPNSRRRTACRRSAHSRRRVPSGPAPVCA